MVITDEPIFDTYPSKEEFMFGEDNEVVMTDKSIFDVYPLEGELELVEVKTMEEIVETELAIEDNINGEIKPDSEQLQVEELSQAMEITPIGISTEIVIPVIVESQQVQKTDELKPLNKNIELSDLNV